MTAAATFMPTVGQAREAGFFPSRHTVEIVDNRMLADGVYRLTFRDEFIAGHAKPAQFVDVYSNNPSRLMPRPFGVAEVDGDEVSLIFAVVGKGTAEFSELRAGDTIRVMGPLGNSFNTKENANYVLVAGRSRRAAAGCAPRRPSPNRRGRRVPRCSDTATCVSETDTSAGTRTRHTASTNPKAMS